MKKERVYTTATCDAGRCAGSAEGEGRAGICQLPLGAWQLSTESSSGHSKFPRVQSCDYGSVEMSKETPCAGGEEWGAASPARLGVGRWDTLLLCKGGTSVQFSLLWMRDQEGE